MSLPHFVFASLLAAFTLASTAHAASQPMPAHEHSAQHSLQPELNAGKKWQTDSTLRRGMAAIHLQLAAATPALHQGELPAAEAQKLAAAIETQVADIVANCKLDAKADAQLHIVIAQLLTGSEQLAGMQPDSSPHQGVMTMLAALDSYIRYFDDPELSHALQH